MSLQRAHIIAFLVVLATTFLGCDTTEVSLHEDEVVVEAYLVAEEEMPQVRLTLTADIDEQYTPAERGIENAQVVIRLLESDGSTDTAFLFRHDATNPGVYLPQAFHRVLPERTYALEAVVPGHGTITAQTIVPGTYELIGLNAASITYRGEDQFELNVSPSTYPSRQNIFVFSLESLEPEISKLTPVYLDLIYSIREDEAFNPDTLDVSELNPFITLGSPPINEGNYDLDLDGNIMIKLPWFFIAFFGKNRVSTSAIDDALYDFIRSQQVQAGGSTLSPGEIPNILNRVVGGKGVFGSMASVSAEVIITE